MIHGHDHQGVGEDADHDGGHAIEQVRRVANHESTTRTAEFRQVYSRQSRRWEAKQRRQEQELQAARRWRSPFRRRFRPQAWAAW